MAGQADVTVGAITAADLMVDEEARARALHEFMLGNPFGSPNRGDQIGLVARNPDEQLDQPSPPDLAEQIRQAEARVQELTAPLQTEEQPTNQELDEFKRKYGQSENEKGEWRRKAQELEETLNLLLSQQQQAQPQVPYHPAYPQAAPVQTPAPMPFFQGKDPGDLVSVQEVREVLDNAIGPALMQTWQQVEAMRMQAVREAKVAAGIDQLAEMRLSAKYPSLRAYPEGPDKIKLMRSLMDADKPRETAPEPPAPQVPQPPQVQAQAREVVRRVTHVESNRGVAGEPAQNQTAAFQAELAEALNAPFAQRSAAMDKVFKKYQVPQVNTLGTGRFRA